MYNKMDINEEFKRDVDEGLSVYPKRLNSKYLYDANGDALFQQITELPEYYLSRAEKNLLASYSTDICQIIGDFETLNIYELGAGWGALAFPLARHSPQSKVVAYELSPVPWVFLELRAFLFGPHNLKIERRNFLKDDLSKASLIVCYLYPGAMAKLSSKLVIELKPSARVISNTFEIPLWTPTAIQSLEDVMCSLIFHYKMESAITSIHQFNDILTTMIV